MTEAELIAYIELDEDFRSLDGLTAQIVEMTSELSAPVQKISQLIMADDRLLGQMLAVLNASFNHFSDPIPNIEQAVTLVGYRKICSLAASIALLRHFPHASQDEYNLSRHWEYALYTAVAGAEFAACKKGDMQIEAFAVGLLQDVGTLLLTRCAPIAYGKALGLSEARDIHVSAGELESIGLSHADASALLCARWKLHPAMRNAAKHHHFIDTDSSLAIDDQTLPQLANLANLAADLYFSPQSESATELLYERAEQFFGLGKARVDEVLKRLPEQAGKLAPPMDVIFSTEAGGKEPDEPQTFPTCPSCGSEATGSGKFCSECGASLAVENDPHELDTNKILVVEDSAATRLALTILIRRLGYEVVEAFNGAEAIRQARKERPGLILMDINMPGMNGLDALAKIRTTPAIGHIPVVMLTSVTNAETVVQALDSGADDYVVKPFSASVVQDRIKKYMTKD